MTHQSQLGKIGEDIACEELVKKSYKIIERNFRRKWGELDIIAKAPDKTLVFVEVKTVYAYSETGIQPEEQLTSAKLKKFKKAASLYAGHWQELIKENKGWRLDLIAITISGLTNGEQNCVIKHYENINA